MNARVSMLGPHAARRHNYFGNAKGGVRYEQTCAAALLENVRLEICDGPLQSRENGFSGHRTQAHPTLGPPFLLDLEVADRMVMVETEAMQLPK
jgi:hypothetical protein